MNAGMLLNGAATALAGLCYVYVALEAHRAREPAEPGARRLLVAFFALGGVLFLFAGLRQAIAFASARATHLVGLDEAWFYVGNVLGALALIPLVMLGVARLARRLWAGLVAGAALAGLAVVGVSWLFLDGASGPAAGFWGSDWVIESERVRWLLLCGYAAPGLLSAAALMSPSPRQQDGRRMGLVGMAALLYIAAMAPDGLGLEGPAFVLVRLLAGGSALLAYLAFAPPRDARPGAGAA